MVRGADPGDASVDKTSLFVCSLAVETLDAGAGGTVSAKRYTSSSDNGLGVRSSMSCVPRL